MPNFVNPYTFIPLGKECVRTDPDPRADDADSKVLTGVISCKLTTKTPIIIPEKKIETVDKGENSVNSCFKIADKPTIPGSSLRGPIRSVYEALTNSCMRINDERLSSAGGRKLPGLLKWDKDTEKYRLFKADRYRVTNDSHRYKGLGETNPWKTGDHVFIDHAPEPEPNAFCTSSGIVTNISDTSGVSEGYYLRVNQMAGRTANKPSVFVEGKCFTQSIQQECVDALEENVRQYIENVNQYIESATSSRLPIEDVEVGYANDYGACLNRLKNGNVLLPVWYSYEQLSSDNYVFHLAWAQLSRNVYPKWTHDFVKDLKLQPCTDARSLCPACDLFGFVDQSGNRERGARAGRVRFTDACAEDDVKPKELALPPLLGPRIHATEFYLRNPNHQNSFTPMTESTQLAGRKMYWSSQGGVRELPNADLAQGENRFATKVKAVQEGAEFHFKVYFDQISKLQLNELVYVLTLGGAWNEGEEHWHKIGHGKPLGAGSVLIDVKDVFIRTCNGSSYTVSSWKDCEPTLKMDLGSESKADTVLHRMSNTKAVMKATKPLNLVNGAVIDYPRKDDGGDIFEWFGRNHYRSTKKPEETIVGYKQVLPGVNDDKQTLQRVFGGHPGLLSYTPPPTVTPTCGTIESLTMTEGGWYGWIKPSRGGSNIFFGNRDNPEITDASNFKKGASVEYEVIVVDYKGETQKHATKVRIV